jgi:F-type H+-transporting ATPase subunit delta
MDNVKHETVLEAGSVRSRLAKVYAEALLAVAEDKHAVTETGDELSHFVSDVLGQAPEIESFFVSPVVGKKAKTVALEAALPGHVSDVMRGFFTILNRNNRLDLLRGIAAAYRELLDSRAGLVPVTVTSAVELSDSQRSSLTGALNDILRKQPVIRVRVDPELLGGLVVKIGDRVIDTSVRTRLQSLRNRLLETPK